MELTCSWNLIIINYIITWYFQKSMNLISKALKICFFFEVLWHPVLKIVCYNKKILPRTSSILFRSHTSTLEEVRTRGINLLHFLNHKYCRIVFFCRFSSMNWVKHWNQSPFISNERSERENISCTTYHTTILMINEENDKLVLLAFFMWAKIVSLFLCVKTIVW